MNKDKVFIILPAYNESQVIGGLIQLLKQADFKNIIVVDDGSEDNTKETAEKAGAQVIRHVLNRGVGAATQTGIEAALRDKAKVIVTMDADCQHEVNDIAKLLVPIENGQAEVVLGNRMESSAMPISRKIGNLIGNLVTWALFGLWVSDSQTGMRAFTRKAAQMIDIRTNGYEACSEIIREINWYKLTYAEVPIEVNYSKYSLSKGQSFANGLVTLGRLIIRSLMR